MQLPKDPIMLLSVINTQLRDRYSSLEELCRDCDSDEDVIREALAAVDYTYDPQQNRFR